MVKLVKKQLSNYYYTFLMALNCDPLHALPLHTKPYHNIWIITVIHNLFFSGRISSFAHMFDKHFPTFKGKNGTMKHEVPIPMVALVATALYAAIHKWHTGSHQAMEFSSNAYLDVYQGHVDTFHHIQDHCPMAFHVMMNDIYIQASAIDGITGIPIAELDLEKME